MNNFIIIYSNEALTIMVSIYELFKKIFDESLINKG